MKKDGQIDRSSSSNGAIKLKPLIYTIEDHGHKTPCWVYQGPCNPQTGYGQIGSQGAHRAAYEATKGPIPEGLELDHLCRVRLCINPDHLEPVTRRVNTMRGSIRKLSDTDAYAVAISVGPALSVARRYGITRQYVYQLRSGTTKRQVPQRTD